MSAEYLARISLKSMCVFRLRLAIQTHTRTLTPNPGTNHLSRLGERRDSRCLAEVHCLQLRRDYSQRRRCCRTARHRGSSFGKVFSSFLYEFPLNLYCRKPKLDPELDAVTGQTLDNSAARHKLSVKPRRTHLSSRHSPTRLNLNVRYTTPVTSHTGVSK
jgi:hypothetical protein